MSNANVAKALSVGDLVIGGEPYAVLFLDANEALDVDPFFAYQRSVPALYINGSAMGALSISGVADPSGFWVSTNSSNAWLRGLMSESDGLVLELANNTVQSGDRDDVYKGVLCRLDSRTTAPFFSVIYQGPFTPSELFPLQICNPGGNDAEAQVLIGNAWGADNNYGIPDVLVALGVAPTIGVCDPSGSGFPVLLTYDYAITGTRGYISHQIEGIYFWDTVNEAIVDFTCSDSTLYTTGSIGAASTIFSGGTVTAQTFVQTGGIVGGIAAKTSNYTATYSDLFLTFDCSASNLTVTLPQPGSLASGTWITIKKLNTTNTLTIATTGGASVETSSLTQALSSTTLVADAFANVWRVVATHFQQKSNIFTGTISTALAAGASITFGIAISAGMKTGEVHLRSALAVAGGSRAGVRVSFDDSSSSAYSIYVNGTASSVYSRNIDLLLSPTIFGAAGANIQLENAQIVGTNLNLTFKNTSGGADTVTANYQVIVRV